MQTRRSTPKTATPFLFLALSALVAAWIGCSAGSSTHQSGGTGTGGTGNANGNGATGTGGGGDAGGDAASCTAQQKFCDGMCVGVDDPMYGCSPMYCTPCGLYANAGATCAGGTCALGACNPGYADCDHNSANGCEADVGTDPNNCGTCGTVCNLPHASATACTNGVCTVQTCDTGWTQCSAGDGGVTDGGAPLGCNANTTGDPNNCGTCGNVCPSGETCAMGKCGMYCGTGQVLCNGACVPLGTNQNCNFCGDTCMLANSNSQCQPQGNRFVCNLVSCNPGWANCDMSSNMNGCQTNTSNDPDNCNSCGNQCAYGPNSTPLCSNSACTIVCNPGYANCNANPQPSQGCPTDINTDTGNCGACTTASQNNACSMNHATENCVAGKCVILTCQSGYTDCDKSASDGCEAATQTDPNNCGTCGNICHTANGTPACVQGMCTIGSCNPGYAACPASTTDCTNTSTNLNNCGTCGNVCSNAQGTPSCSGGACSIQCNPGFSHCIGPESNGCETNIDTTSNCGSCGAQCLPSQTCNSGVCTCPAGTPTVCNGACVNEGTDANNCGGCGKVCDAATCGGAAGNVATTTCTGGVCEIALCLSGFASTDTKCSDGVYCECPISAALSTCPGEARSLGSLPVGSNPSSATSTLFPGSPNAAYYTMTFSGNTNDGTPANNYANGYHPTITLSDPSSEGFVMDVTSDCNSLINGCAAGLTTWEVQYTGGDSTSKTPGGVSNFLAIPNVGNGGIVYVKVYRKSGTVKNCAATYTVTATNP